MNTHSKTNRKPLIKKIQLIYKHMYLQHIPIERLEQIHREREETQSNPQFIQWIKELNVSRMWLDRTLILNAREAMRDWNPNLLRIK